MFCSKPCGLRGMVGVVLSHQPVKDAASSFYWEGTNEDAELYWTVISPLLTSCSCLVFSCLLYFKQKLVKASQWCSLAQLHCA